MTYSCTSAKSCTIDTIIQEALSSPICHPPTEDSTCRGSSAWEGRQQVFCLAVELSFPLCFWLGSHHTRCYALRMLVLAALWWNRAIQKEIALKEKIYSPLCCDESRVRLHFFPILVKERLQVILAGGGGAKTQEVKPKKHHRKTKVPHGRNMSSGLIWWLLHTDLI